MNDEIKEILDKLKDGSWYNELDLTGTMWIELRWEETHLLLDYITNLQQENEDNLKCIKSIKEQLESVINENQRLLNKWFENNDKIVELISEKEVYNESLKDYKSRIEKAIEYINYYGTTPEENDDTTCRHILKSLLNILNGRSD